MKGVSHTIKIAPFGWNTKGQMKFRHGKSFCRNRHSGRRICGWSVTSRITAHLRTFYWKSGFIGRNIPTCYHKSCLRDMTPTKRRGRIRRHHAPRPKTWIHIRRRDKGWKVRRHVWNTMRKMIRVLRHWLSIIIFHTIMKHRWILPHEMREFHGGGSIKWGSQRDSSIHDNDNSRHNITS
jgi:hypothetical protein